MEIAWLSTVVVIIAGVLSMLCSKSAGLTCLTCRSSSSLADCYSQGKIEVCWQRNHVCYTEIRYEQPNHRTGLYDHRRINAGCKQKFACLNDQKQNPRNCHHRIPRSPQRCYQCCNSPECMGTREKQRKPICEEAMKSFFRRFDANLDGIIHSWEASIQTEGRRMKSKSFFTDLLFTEEDFFIRGITFKMFSDVMTAWLEEQKLVADVDSSGAISFWEFYIFLQQQKQLSVGPNLSRMQALAMFKRIANTKVHIDLCNFMKIYTDEVSTKLTVIRCNERRYTPMHGTKTCTNSNIAGSRCVFTCKPGYNMIGTDSVTCMRTAKWDRKAPFCKRIKCSELEKPSGGALTCTDYNLAFSTCRTSCNASMGFVRTGNDVTTCTAQGRWTEPVACCSRPCPPYATLDLILVFDSSSSVGVENWAKLMKFCAEIVGSFHIGLDTVRVGAFRYNAEVDKDTEVKLGDITSMEELHKAVHSLPYNGTGTRTGNALLHAYEYSLKVEGNRENVRDVVLIFTDGVSHDEVAYPAKMLQDMGVDVNVIGIKNLQGKLDTSQMEQMASDPISNHVMIISGGFQSLTNVFVDRISSLVCGNPCEHLLT